MARRMRGGNFGPNELMYPLIGGVISFVVLYFLYRSVVNFFVEISRRSWAAILGGLVGLWFAPSLASFRPALAVDLITLFLMSVFPLLIWTFDTINQQLPQDEYVKTTASFIEGGIMGAIVTTIIANLFPVDF
jgi:hypothetical protein